MSMQRAPILMSGKGSEGLVTSLYKASSRSTRLLIVSALISLTFGLWGWYALRDALYLNAGDIIYRSIAALSFSVPYQHAASWAHDWRIEIARWSGMFAFVVGAGKTVFLLLEKHWVRKGAERRRQHWLVIGADPFAWRLCAAAVEQNKFVHWLAAFEGPEIGNKLLFVDYTAWSIEQGRSLGLANAMGAVVAMDDDAATYAIAREIRKSVPDERKLTVMASIRSPWLAMRVDEIEGVHGIRVFSEAQISVRRLQRRNPPFLIAEALGHKRLHTVICGFSEYGEAVLVETLLSSLTTRLKKPLFTIIDPFAGSIENDLRTRYPELAKSADFFFVTGQVSGGQNVLSPEILTKVSDSSPISVFYSCHLRDDKSLTAALALQTISLKTSSAPVFTRLFTADTLQQAPLGAERLTPGQLVGFGALNNLAMETGLFSNQADGLARAFHRAYLTASPTDKVGHVDWEDLSEDMRDANRRLVVHIPAKLHCLGLDLEKWLEKTEEKSGLVNLPKIANPDISDKRVEMMAILEHERWMVDRRINGWVYGPERDYTRREHPDLVAFDYLCEQSKAYDREMVLSLLNMCRV